MKPSIKAIETRYKGYRFRSRLEARWAVFFDACGIKWVYEPEGFLLNNGESYLPDFFLPDFEIYAEVKAISGDFRKSRLFCESTGNDIILLEDAPALRFYDTVTYNEETNAISEDTFRVFFDIRIFPNGDGKTVMSYEGPDAPWWHTDDIVGIIENYGFWRSNYPALRMIQEGIKRIESAISKARGARFEFGESGE